MIPYIVINGVSSKTINGLLIQSLPPISKPPIRTNIEEIDGKDGDLVEVLGYGAYDKSLVIGLKADANVDDVLNYFNSSGKITFSNEKDKYYNYAIYQQIDLEKLLRFKQATVEMHVQPFKYSADEVEINLSYTDTSRANIDIRNNGNIFSKPKLTITARLGVDILINNTQILHVDFGTSEETIIFDPVDMNAIDEDGEYKNRQVTGDYSDIKLETGVNTLTVSGDVSNVKIANYSRWI